jgi:hypothetical protein
MTSNSWSSFERTNISGSAPAIFTNSNAGRGGNWRKGKYTPKIAGQSASKVNESPRAPKLKLRSNNVVNKSGLQSAEVRMGTLPYSQLQCIIVLLVCSFKT